MNHDLPLFGFALLLLTSFAAAAVEQAKPHDISKMWKTSLERKQLASNAVFDSHGTVWLARVQERHVVVSHSEDLGKNFSVPVMVNQQAEFISASGETRPKILLSGNGNIYISYTQSLEQPFAGNIRFSRSVDGGKSFSAPITVNDNLELITHRFETMGVNARGQIYLAWLDKRDAQSAKSKGEQYAGIALYSAMSDNEGKSFQANLKLADHTCECCRVAMAIDQTDTPVVVWRHIFGQNTRDHALARLDGKPREEGSGSGITRVTFDNWQVDACPHHGPSLSSSADVLHLTWFNQVVGKGGLFYAYSKDAGKTFSAPRSVGNPDKQAAHPAILSTGKNVYLAWKEFDGELTVIKAMRSLDGGMNWGKEYIIAETRDQSDHPLLIAYQQKVFLSWSTLQEGYRLLPVQESLP